MIMQKKYIYIINTFTTIIFIQFEPEGKLEKKHYHCPFNNSYLSIPMPNDLILSLKIII